MYWFQDGSYEHEVSRKGGFTGWYRCVGGRLDCGLWPEWNAHTGETRYGA